MFKNWKAAVAAFIERHLIADDPSPELSLLDWQDGLSPRGGWMDSERRPGEGRPMHAEQGS